MSFRERVAGVDFSGARDAGKNIWIAEGRATSGGVAISALARAADLPGGGTGFEHAMTALVAHIAGLGDALVGLDFPFGLPRTLISEPSWTGFVGAFAREHDTSDAFRADCRARSAGRELKRRTDTEARVPWCAYNLRLYRQTWAGIRHVLAPLVLDGKSRAIPMQTPEPGLPALAETCPASLLKREDLYAPYKGRGDGPRRGREAILEALVARQTLRPLPGLLRETVLANTGGDALDAVLAAVGAARIDDPAPRDATDRIEARVYF
jgi:hypothetical protein